MASERAPVAEESAGSTTSNAANGTRAATAATGGVASGLDGACDALAMVSGYRYHPTQPPAAMTPTCATAPGYASRRAADPRQSDTRARSVHSFFPMPHTACATTATAATFKPWSQPAP